MVRVIGSLEKETLRLMSACAFSMTRTPLFAMTSSVILFPFKMTSLISYPFCGVICSVIDSPFSIVQYPVNLFPLSSVIEPPSEIVKMMILCESSTPNVKYPDFHLKYDPEVSVPKLNP